MRHLSVPTHHNPVRRLFCNLQKHSFYVCVVVFSPGHTGSPSESKATLATHLSLYTQFISAMEILFLAFSYDNYAIGSVACTHTLSKFPIYP